jgi:hypothetical protein
MTSDCHLEEEWFSLPANGSVDTATATPATPVAAVPTPDLFIEIRKLHHKIEALQSMVHAQSEEIRALKSASQADRIGPLLEELKRVKERELNYALRCHQPVPFFDARSIVRLVGPGLKGVGGMGAGTAVAGSVAKTAL